MCEWGGCLNYIHYFSTTQSNSCAALHMGIGCVVLHVEIGSEHCTPCGDRMCCAETGSKWGVLYDLNLPYML